MGKVTIEEMEKNYQSHDCHLSPDSGCIGCDEYFAFMDQKDPVIQDIDDLYDYDLLKEQLA